MTRNKIVAGFDESRIGIPSLAEMYKDNGWNVHLSARKGDISGGATRMDLKMDDMSSNALKQ